MSSTKSRIRSVFVFSVGELPKQQLLGTLAVNFKLLKVLDLQGAPLDKLHEAVGNLLHLRYLSVKRTKVEIIPKSIGNLQNLQTLNLKDSQVSMLQIVIFSRLRKLRHLIIPPRVKIREGIEHLEELQMLQYVEANDDLIKELENLRQLRKLGICYLKREHGKALRTAIEKMNHLQSLWVWAIGSDEILDLHSFSCPPVSLQHLYLNGRLETLPNWISRLDNLVFLKLIQSRLTGAHAIKALQALPNLIELNFFNGYDGEQLFFDVGGFPKLKSLYFRGLEGLNSLVREEGGLPVLKKLQIVCCPQLKEVPSGIRNLRELKSLVFWDVPTKFLDRMQPGIGQDYWVIEHIPNVQFVWYDEGGLFRVGTPREFQDVRESQRLNDEPEELEGVE
ncbi:disease resistance protein RPM1-like [Rhododendron vialii]|uniref:disease resistance protein RPM1-like n=1 Tax=Rhododendron vialii TaxID=182163 RepID=UPI00265E41B9|nr:disease resistance protein RPM1-like [Rhododendron vialii]XP_058201507.1 disease resistance protein RPM1-like [Rhododendron vialii]